MVAIALFVVSFLPPACLAGGLPTEEHAKANKEIALYWRNYFCAEIYRPGISMNQYLAAWHGYREAAQRFALWVLVEEVQTAKTSFGRRLALAKLSQLIEIRLIITGELPGPVPLGAIPNVTEKDHGRK